MFIILVGMEGAARLQGKEFTNEKNVKFMKIDQLDVDFKLKKSRFKIRDVINHSNLIGKRQLVNL